jgi:hypothetical protein
VSVVVDGDAASCGCCVAVAGRGFICDVYCFCFFVVGAVAVVVALYCLISF